MSFGTLSFVVVGEYAIQLIARGQNNLSMTSDVKLSWTNLLCNSLDIFRDNCVSENCQLRSAYILMKIRPFLTIGWDQPQWGSVGSTNMLL